jgi:hypothetical protein
MHFESRRDRITCEGKIWAIVLMVDLLVAGGGTWENDENLPIKVFKIIKVSIKVPVQQCV